MEENILQEVPDFKLHKKRTITICTFLTGPLVAGYLIAENFNQLNERRNAIKTWIVTILVAIISFGSVLIPALEKIPNILFILLYTIMTSYLVQRFQQPRIILHSEKGGQFFPVWRAVLASIICLAISLALVFLILFIAAPEAFI